MQNVTVLYHGSVIIDEAEVVLSYGNRYITLLLLVSHLPPSYTLLACIGHAAPFRFARFPHARKRGMCGLLSTQGLLYSPKRV